MSFPTTCTFFHRGASSHWAVGRFAWYNVDFSAGKPLINVKEELSSRRVITSFVSQIKTEYKLNEVYLGGFSQGAIMSFSIGLSNPDKIDGIICFSGRILEDIQTSVVKNANHADLRVFLAHGRQYSMGHQINRSVLNDLSNWLTIVRGR